jgi:hypothetical protein
MCHNAKRLGLRAQKKKDERKASSIRSTQASGIYIYIKASVTAITEALSYQTEALAYKCLRPYAISF